jgi:hypothetical protein
MSDLRTRIAAALKARYDGFAADWLNAPWEEVADAVITELQLDKQFGCPVAGHHSCRCSHRYTTPWKDNDD